MALVATFLGTSSIPASGIGPAYKIWSYKIEGNAAEMPTGHRFALALPADINVLSPGSFPGVPALQGMFLEREQEGSRQYVGRTVGAAGPQVIAFAAPARESTGDVLLVKASSGSNPWIAVPFLSESSGSPSHAQKMTLPAPGAPVYAGRPLADFIGTLPYASELFGVYQPLSGWFGAHSSMAASAAHSSTAFAGLDTLGRFKGDAARNLSDSALKALAAHYDAAASGGLSPVGLVNLFREYFFEFDNFLGPPAGHIWVSPGGTVEVVETSSRRTLIEKVAEQSEEISRKTEESLTEQDDVADAVKEDNSSDTKLGVSATGGVNAKIYHADVSASFSTQNTVKRGSEITHKHTRTQTAKATSEIKRNFKTTFKTVTETTDTSSRRYLLENKSANELVNYELRRKMRKVGVQLQHIGTRLCWQVYLGDPGKDLGLGDMVHVVEAPDLTGLSKPEKLPPPEEKLVPFHFDIPFEISQGPDEQEAEETYVPTPGLPCRGRHENPPPEKNDIIQFCFDRTVPPPPPGYELSKIHSIDHHGAQIQYTTELQLNPDVVKLQLTYANFQGKRSLPFDAMLLYVPTAAAVEKIDKLNAAREEEYKKEVARLQHDAYGKAVRERLRLVSSMRARPPEDLRSEERRLVFRNLIRWLETTDQYPKDPKHLPYPEAEGIQQFFDVDEMLYFVAPDFWRPVAVNPPPVNKDSVGRYPVPPEYDLPSTGKPQPLLGQTVAGWYSRAHEYMAIDAQAPPTSSDSEWRVNYLVTEQTHPAPLGSSLGWLIQIDADERRNEFLNSAWVKAVLPIRPGQETAALSWLTEVEGEAGLGVAYSPQPLDPGTFTGTVGQVLTKLATQLSEADRDADITRNSEKVFEAGFDPLAGGFKPAEPYQVFDQWIEVLPTDQVAAVAVKYDAKTGQQL
jgi:hypothetical protein